MGKEDVEHVDFLSGVACDDIEHIKRKEAKYKGSWKKRGGPGAFHNLVRKWDRIEVELKENYGDDIFRACREDPDFRENEIGDLRRYLMLVEAHLRNTEQRK